MVESPSPDRPVEFVQSVLEISDVSRSERCRSEQLSGTAKTRVPLREGALLLLVRGEERCHPLFHARGGCFSDDLIVLGQRHDIAGVAGAAVRLHVKLRAIGTKAILPELPDFPVFF